MPDYSKEFLELLHSVTAKRPKTVITHILKHGFITTEQLKELYGYNHPPRAIRDVKECGIPIETYRVTASDGKKIAAYKFGNPQQSRFTKLSGRTSFSKAIKEQLIAKYSCKCFIYQEIINERDLQIDHRVPFEINGNNETDIENFMLLSSSANRAKSWSCEHCENWQQKDKQICLTCYWAFPEDYSHIAMLQIRRMDLIWQNNEVEKYEALKKQAILNNQTLPEFVKSIIDRVLKV
ncbi:MAG: hypothetical protein RL637_729 [Pseudomonadota bacterium]|jgi:hypothetical protein